MRRMLAVALLLPLAGCTVETTTARGPADNRPTAKLGQPAPSLEGTDVDGKTIKLSDYRGKVVVLDFWATWCPRPGAARKGPG